MNLAQFLSMMGKGADIGSAGAKQHMSDQAELEKLLKGKEADAQNKQAEIKATAEESRLTKEKSLQDSITQAARMYGVDPNNPQALRAAMGKNGAGFHFSPEGFAVGADPTAKQGARVTPAQHRAEAVALNNAYTAQTKDVKEQQAALDQIVPLLDDPTNVDDQQLRRQLAMAVNKGALTDKDVEDSLPSDIGVKARQAVNFMQPLLAPLGVEKQPIYTPDARASIKKLIEGKRGALDSRINEANQQIEMLAPHYAPSMSEDPDGLRSLITGITTPRTMQQKRITTGLSDGSAIAGQNSATPPAGPPLSKEEFLNARKKGLIR